MTRREVERALNDAFRVEAGPFHGVLLVALEAQTASAPPTGRARSRESIGFLMSDS